MPKQNPVAENVLGTMGTICWTGQLIPQVWKSYRDKKTTGLSPWLMLIWGVSSAFLGVYSVLQDFNIPLQVQPQLFGFLALVSWGQCLYYDPKRQGKKYLTFIMIVGTMVIVGALEVMLVFVSRPAYERGISAPVKLYGILSVVLIGSGLIPQYWEIYVRREVTGVSYTFILIDMLGGLLSDLSLVFSSEFDGLAAASYTAVFVMDSVIIFAALYLNPRARKRRRRAAAAVEAGIETESTSPSATSGQEDTSQVPHPGEIDIHLEEGKVEFYEKKSIEDVQATNPRLETEGDEKSNLRGVPMCRANSVGNPPSVSVSGTTAVAVDAGSLNSESQGEVVVEARTSTEADRAMRGR